MTKIYYNGKRLNTPMNRFKSFMTKLFRLALVILIFTGIVVGLIMIGRATSNKVVYTKQEVIKEVEMSTPILDKIAKAESRNSHYCTEELVKFKMCASSELGQVLIRANKNGTVDIGRYQINNYYWGAKATEQGLNLWDEKDNYKMALWIYKNYGTEPWESSSKNW